MTKKDGTKESTGSTEWLFLACWKACLERCVRLNARGKHALSPNVIGLFLFVFFLAGRSLSNLPYTICSPTACCPCLPTSTVVYRLCADKREFHRYREPGNPTLRCRGCSYGKRMEKVTFAGPTDNTCDHCFGTPDQRDTDLF